MEITEEMLAAIPPGNVLRPLDEFGTFWRLAEGECLRLVLATPMGETSRELSYASAVMGTARWLAGAQVPLGPPSTPIWKDAPSPFRLASGGFLGVADQDTIRQAREESRVLLVMFPNGYKTAGMPPRPGYLEGVRDTIEWAHFHGPLPQLGQRRSGAASPQ